MGAPSPRPLGNNKIKMNRKHHYDFTPLCTLDKFRFIGFYDIQVFIKLCVLGWNRNGHDIQNPFAKCRFHQTFLCFVRLFFEECSIGCLCIVCWGFVCSFEALYNILMCPHRNLYPHQIYPPPSPPAPRPHGGGGGGPAT